MEREDGVGTLFVAAIEKAFRARAVKRTATGTMIHPIERGTVELRVPDVFRGPSAADVGIVVVKRRPRGPDRLFAGAGPPVGAAGHLRAEGGRGGAGGNL